MDKLYFINIWLSTNIDSTEISFTRNDRGKRTYREVSQASRGRLKTAIENLYHEIYIGNGYISIDVWVS